MTISSMDASADSLGRQPLFVAVGEGDTRSSSAAGIKALMLAILEDAIRTYLGPDACERDAVAVWMATDGPHWVFSFPVVCETLSLEPSAVRAAVIAMDCDREPTLRARSRPNVRRDRRDHVAGISRA